MRLVVGSFAILSTLLCLVLTIFITGMVQLVGMGKDFWAVPIVWIDVFFGLVSVVAWVWIIRRTLKKEAI